MAPETARSVVLLPIHPKYANSILDGTKRVEFRKQRFARDISHVVVYATTPLKQVLGYFEVSGIVEAAPKALWKKFRLVGGIGHDDFMDYFAERRRGIAIEVKRAWRCGQPKPLRSFLPGKYAPQGFAYVTAGQFGRIRAA
jgi:predicted transcriptional regulator